MPFGNWPLEKQAASENPETNRFLDYIIGEIELARKSGEWKEENIVPFFKRQLIRFYSFYCFAFKDQSLVEKKEAVALMKQISEEALMMAAVQLFISQKKESEE